MGEDCKAFGIDPALLAAPTTEGEGVWPDHLEAVTAFLAVSTQWRVLAGEGGAYWLGLDHAAAKAGLDLAGISLTPAQWADVQMIEAGAKAALNET